MTAVALTTGRITQWHIYGRTTSKDFLHQVLAVTVGCLSSSYAGIVDTFVINDAVTEDARAVVGVAHLSI